MGLTEEQQKIVDNTKKMLIVSASAGSGKTFVLIKYIANLIINKKIPLKRFLVLTFTKAAAREMKERLLKAILEVKQNSFLTEQIDEMPSCDISTIDAFCEKVLKQNLSKIDLDENFSMLDEKQSFSLKQKAFDKTMEYFTENHSEDLAEILFAFKKNKETIFQNIENISNFFDSQEDEEYLIDYYLNNSEKIFAQACKVLNENLKKEFALLAEYLFNFNSQDALLMEEYKALNKILYLPLGEDYIENINLLSKIEKPKLTQKKIDFENQQILKNVASSIKNAIDEIKSFDISPYSLKKQELAVLPNAILKFYVEYKNNYKEIKKNYDFIDFADCEKIVKKLLEDDEVLKNLQNSYDYIFIDEYQDTNKLQESIIKPIAEKGMFMAVGDIKQGIYGFRNASMEIMLKDIENFANKQDSDALFLKSNFRSDKTILDFVNFIFEKVMTEESCGVDYANTSMLDGKQAYKKTKNPSVEVFICKNEKEEKKDLPAIYSVKDDILRLKSSNSIEANIIVDKIKNFLNSQIYNAKTEKFENVKPQDIAVIFRKRSETMNEVYNLLLKNNIPATTDEKKLLFKSPVVQVLNNLLKLLISKDDDIALSSVMLSPVGGFSFKEISEIALNQGKTFFEKCQTLKNSNEKIFNFYQKLDEFEMLVQVKGVVEAFKLFLNKLNFFQNLPFEIIDEQEKQNVEDFYNLIYSINAQFNVAKIIHTFENADVKSSAIAQSDNSVILTTIHATKGLEYPIVIIPNCGEYKEKGQSVVLSRNYGIATNVYDNVTLTKSPSIVLKAIKYENKKKSWTDELMIFYVALTRAKNHLVLCGTEKDFVVKNNIKDCKTYFDFLFYSLGENLVSALENQGEIENDLFSIKIIENEINKIENQEKTKEVKKLTYNKEDLYNDLNYNYKNEDFCNLQLKNSVTSINENSKVEELKNNNNVFKDEDFINIGNSYHHALKHIDFDKIFDLVSLTEEINNNLELKSEIENVVDYNLLLKNILIIKQYCKDKKIYKEKDFVMNISLKDLNINENEEKLIVQGAIDCFAVGDNEIILIDYKYTNMQDDEVLKNRYKMQLNLYSKALNKAFKDKDIKVYLLSLKYGKVIKF